MKLNKIFFLISFIYLLFSSIVVSQSNYFNELRKNDKERLIQLNSTEQIERYDISKIVKNSSVTEGSPFNSIYNSQIDSVVVAKIISSSMDEIGKYYYAYDSSGNVIAEIKKDEWKQSNTYDSYGNLTTIIFRFWEDDQWLNDTHQANFYDSIGKRTSLLYQRWKDTVWVNEYKVKYFYNSHGDLTSYLSQDWDGSKWINSFQSTYTYDSNYYLISSLHQNWGWEDWDGVTWRYSYTYDLSGNEILQLDEDFYNNKWVNADRIISTYDKKDNRIQFVWENWDDKQWNTRARVSYTYDNYRNIITSFSEDLEKDKWINVWLTTYFYNVNGDLSFAENKNWINNNWILSNGGMSIFDSDGNRRNYFGKKMNVYYATNTDIKEEKQPIEDYSLSQNYPNPFNPSTTIKYHIPSNVKGEMSSTKLVVFDILGHEVITLVDKEQRAGSYEVEFNAPADGLNLTSGVYFYSLHVLTGSTTNFIKTRKLILLK